MKLAQKALNDKNRPDPLLYGKSRIAARLYRGFIGVVTNPAFALMRTFWRLPWPDRLLLVEATLCLAIAALAIAVLPFRNIGHLATRRIRRAEMPAQARLATVRRIRWAIAACARRVPWSAVCFQKGLAAQVMLRRRGVPSVLYYGAAPNAEHGLAAHVWVKAGEAGVVGHEISHQFAILAKYPEEKQYFSI